ncbi:MAG: 4-hydroxy-3-methylbut-2-enyl diphosphate reductase [Ignavibacteria bacterium]|nr:4-hydroxy-3-methylbut-2-enyl diphosphate reductase [Ignavibacteria bacterium]MBT8381979.1 4-hydroxy-3-methylbut-2-enyl diphosphate reductase [Ignavibacteria bacterium]MBT8393112.1 4-hydroxy-3-methylbut-2-enyl diphosphate reductase [Ignavibacteria bacterium]NNJ53406.1 4-hydroxy-3-methylbut-2-enyl diphosphate reductase [Ignavibacteriaceae bacterium]NNL20807.1 4-hydroxy-3-methylbut-2-enyl diphosphate reductase [Ignavibacteriaceae bacterium]
MKKFDIPVHYRSSFITQIKNNRKTDDPRKKDFSPTVLDFGPVKFYLARHFGFCYGVENAIEIAYKTIEENPGKRIFLLSEMIHNPAVNNDLISMGVRFIMDTDGSQLVAWDEISPKDIVIIPAFGTTIEIEKKLNKLGIDPYKYDTTCPFVEKVWNRSAELGSRGYTVIIHGKHYHEETRATFSHSTKKAPSLMVRDIKEAEFLSDFILGIKTTEEFEKFFDGKYSDDFDIDKDLDKLGVVNQTTMLATETQEIADLLKEMMIKKYGIENLKEHFADTRDTLCYATNDNQDATYGLLEESADFAIVIGGYNSSNTGHIAKLCEQEISTYFISSADKIISENEIIHFDFNSNSEKITLGFLPDKYPVEILVTSGASCPDAVVESVMRRMVSLFENVKDVDAVVNEILEQV